MLSGTDATCRTLELSGDNSFANFTANRGFTLATTNTALGAVAKVGKAGLKFDRALAMLPTPSRSAQPVPAQPDSRAISSSAK